MAVGQKEHILIRGIHIEGGIMFHHLKVEGGKIVGTAQGTTGVAAGSAMYHTNNVSADLSTEFLKLCGGFLLAHENEICCEDGLIL